MKDYKRQLKSWYPNGNFDSKRFEYDALNGNIDVLNAKQINQKATKARKTATTRSTKMRMSRLINATKRNPHMHRIANVWNMGQAIDYSNSDNPFKTGKTALNYINTKAKMESDAENQLIMSAQKGKLINKFAKGWNKYNPEKIINSKQDGLTAKSQFFNLEKYPQIKSNNFKKFLNHNKYFNGIKETVAYVNGNHMNDIHTIKLLHHLNDGIHHINNDMEYTAIHARLKSAYRYTSTIKRHSIRGIKQMINMDKSTHDFQDVPEHLEQLNHIKHLNRSKLLEKAYAYKYGVGNDQVANPGEPIFSPLEDGKKNFHKALNIIHRIDNQSQTNHANALLKSVGLSTPSHTRSKINHYTSNSKKSALHIKKKQHHIVRTAHGRTKKISRNDFQI